MAIIDIENLQVNTLIKPLLILLLVLGAGALALVLTLRRRARINKELEERHQSLKQLRLYKMLEHIGVDQRAYLRKVPRPLVEQQMSRCARCAAVDLCDACLRDGRCLVDMHFCPNYASLMAQSKYFDNKST